MSWEKFDAERGLHPRTRKQIHTESLRKARAVKAARQQKVDDREAKVWVRQHPPKAANVVAMYKNASPQEIEDGMSWYADAHYTAEAFAKQSGLSVNQSAGMLAAYSPQTAWATNMLRAARSIRTRKAVGGKGSGEFATESTKAKAQAILDGGDYKTILTGQKINAFGQLIENGGDPDPLHPLVVVDRHALSVASGDRAGVDEYKAARLGTKGQYAKLSKVFVDAAAQLSKETGKPISAHQLQAITWLTQQRMNQAADLAASSGKVAKSAGQARKAWDDWKEFSDAAFPGLDVARTGYSLAQEWQEFIELAVVRTAGGSDRFHEPIGAPIVRHERKLAGRTKAGDKGGRAAAALEAKAKSLGMVEVKNGDVAGAKKALEDAKLARAARSKPGDSYTRAQIVKALRDAMDKNDATAAKDAYNELHSYDVQESEMAGEAKQAARVKAAEAKAPRIARDKSPASDPASVSMAQLADEKASHGFQVDSGVSWNRFVQSQVAQDKVMQMDDSEPAKAWSLYQVNGPYQEMNNYLRTGHTKPGKTHDQYYVGKTLSAGMIKAFDKYGTKTKEPMVTYRGIRPQDGFPVSMGQAKVGDSFVEKGIMSTATDRDNVMGFMDTYGMGKVNGSNTILEIHIPAGQTILGAGDGSIETMLPPGTKLKIVRIERRAIVTKTVDQSGQHVSGTLNYVTTEVV